MRLYGTVFYVAIKEYETHFHSMQPRILFTGHMIQLKPKEKITTNYTFIGSTRTPLFLDFN